MKRTLLFTLGLCLSVLLSAQFAYEIVPFTTSNSNQKGFIFTGVKIGTSSGYMTTSQEKSLRTQYGFDKEQIVSLLGTDDLYHIIIADSDRSNTSTFSKVAAINPAAERVDIFKPGSKPAVAANAETTESNTPATTAKTGTPVAKTVANTTVSKGATATQYKIQVAALKSPMSDDAAAKFSAKTGISNLDSRYDQKSGMYKYYLPGNFPDYNAAKSAISNLGTGLKSYKPFITKN